MTARDLVDPESRGPLEAYAALVPGGFNSIQDIKERRATIERIQGPLRLPVVDGVSTTDRLVPGPEGAPDVLLREYRPTDLDGVLPLIYHIHGGGMILGSVAGDDFTASTLAVEVGAVVVSVEYRLAPEHPHPAQVEDCYAGLRWAVEHAEELGVDPSRVALYGASAGGGLVLAVALLARDRGGPTVAFQMPIYPMLDDRNDTPSSHEIVDVGVWDRAAHLRAWQWYLGGQEADAYAAPARATDLRGLPPTFLDVGTVDMFRDEDITFAQRLMQAGVPTELHVVPGSYHASESIAPQAQLSREIWERRYRALRRALHREG